MPRFRYQEDPLEHASRIGVTPHFVKVRRRVLADKLVAQALPSDAPPHLHEATAKTLMATLAVKPQAYEQRNGTHTLVPTFVRPTRDRVQGLISRRERRKRLAARNRPGAEETLAVSDTQ